MFDDFQTMPPQIRCCRSRRPQYQPVSCQLSRCLILFRLNAIYHRQPLFCTCSRFRRFYRRSRLWQLCRSEPEMTNSLTDTRRDRNSCGYERELSNKFPKQRRRNKSWKQSEPNHPRNWSPSIRSGSCKSENVLLCSKTRIWHRRNRFC